MPLCLQPARSARGHPGGADLQGESARGRLLQSQRLLQGQRGAHTARRSTSSSAIGLEPTPPFYDIGFFASGDWARLDGKYWAARRGRCAPGQFRAQPVRGPRRERVLAALIDYARSRRRSLRIYLHPYERRLVNEHGIEPPFRDLADGEQITIDDAPGQRRAAAVYECDVAVALRSSTIWERIDLGLERSLIYCLRRSGARQRSCPSLWARFRPDLVPLGRRARGQARPAVGRPQGVS